MEIVLGFVFQLLVHSALSHTHIAVVCGSLSFLMTFSVENTYNTLHTVQTLVFDFRVVSGSVKMGS